jgi:hypothetical protein
MGRYETDEDILIAPHFAADPAHGDRRPGKLFGHPFDQAKSLNRSTDAFGPDD